MSRFLSGFWGGGGQEAAPEEEGDAAGSTGAASWITMRDPAGGRGEPVMTVNQATVDGVLNKLGDEGAVNVVAIFGAARGGKSFLMNQLAGQDDVFKISNDKVQERVGCGVVGVWLCDSGVRDRSDKKFRSFVLGVKSALSVGSLHGFYAA